jgi:2-oxoglutarate ferredoxin oxidoreductase subunit beta
MSWLPNDYFRDQRKPNWCPGCGNYATLVALRQALCDLQIDPASVVIVGGIGCGANLPYWMDTYSLIALHGRAIPTAMGVKLANPKLHVIVVAGDGDTYGIGLGHFIHAIRNDVNITLLVGNNGVYGLTKGQASPTAKKGQMTPSTPRGLLYDPLNPLALAITTGCRFVARGYAGDADQLADLMKQAINFDGLAYIDILQPCVKYNKNFGYPYYQDRVVDLQKTAHPVQNRMMALDAALRVEEKIPTGILFLEPK